VHAELQLLFKNIPDNEISPSGAGNIACTASSFNDYIKFSLNIRLST
jgi:hypothetical protein